MEDDEPPEPPPVTGHRKGKYRVNWERLGIGSFGTMERKTGLRVAIRLFAIQGRHKDSLTKPGGRQAGGKPFPALSLSFPFQRKGRKDCFFIYQQYVVHHDWQLPRSNEAGGCNEGLPANPCLSCQEFCPVFETGKHKNQKWPTPGNYRCFVLGRFRRNFMQCETSVQDGKGLCYLDYPPCPNGKPSA